MANENLSKAKRAKNDEFYTQYPDIEKEVSAYLDYNPNAFKDKTVLLPCDDPDWSNFTKYFAQSFQRLGLKKLVGTSYAEASKPYPTGREIPDWEKADPKFDPEKAVRNGKMFVIDRDRTGNGRIDYADMEWSYLEGDGDFRSGEVKRLRDEADMVVTNPPFSLFREFLAWFREKSPAQFLIIGNINAITYKEVFPLIKKDEVWLGPSISSGDREFEMPKAVVDLAKFTGAIRGGRYYQKVMGVRWFTNIEHGRRHEPLRLMTEADVVRYGSKQPFQEYDNYDAIEVPKTKWIPSDYKGVMGVPISFLDKYCPEQFEIVGATQRGCHDELPDTRKYDDYWEVKPNGEKTGASGGKTNENANLLGNDGKKNYFINSEGRIVQSAYQRIFIRHRKYL
jgi:hypothetical protein